MHENVGFYHQNQCKRLIDLINELCKMKTCFTERHFNKLI